MYEDRTLTCRDCGDGFIFSGGEQRFFAEKGLQNSPQRCPSCRANAKRVRMGGPREYHAAVCNACGVVLAWPAHPDPFRVRSTTRTTLRAVLEALLGKESLLTAGEDEAIAAVCNACGDQAMVPFAPRTDRPVYCSTCFDKVRAGLITPAVAPANP